MEHMSAASSLEQTVGIKAVGDYRQFKKRKFMIHALSKVTKKSLGIRSDEFELVSVIVRPSETTLIIDYFGDQNFIRKLQHAKGHLLAGYKEVFRAKDPHYALRFEICIETGHSENDKERLWKIFVVFE